MWVKVRKLWSETADPQVVRRKELSEQEEVLKGQSEAMDLGKGLFLVLE